MSEATRRVKIRSASSTGSTSSSTSAVLIASPPPGRAGRAGRSRYRLQPRPSYRRRWRRACRANSCRPGGPAARPISAKTTSSTACGYRTGRFACQGKSAGSCGLPSAGAVQDLLERVLAAADVGLAERLGALHARLGQLHRLHLLLLLRPLRANLRGLQGRPDDLRIDAQQVAILGDRLIDVGIVERPRIGAQQAADEGEETLDRRGGGGALHLRQHRNVLNLERLAGEFLRDRRQQVRAEHDREDAIDIGVEAFIL